jgi:hypothetical protein
MYRLRSRIVCMSRPVKVNKDASLLQYRINYGRNKFYGTGPRGCIFSCVQPFYEQAVSNLDP